MDVTGSLSLIDADGETLTVTGGEDEAGRGARYLELRLERARVSARLSWSDGGTTARSRHGDTQAYRLTVNGGKAREVVSTLGLLVDGSAYARGDLRPVELPELEPLWAFLKGVDVDGSAVLASPEVAVLRFSLGDWASCVADFAGAGAGLGAAGGLVGGGPAGAATGGAVGGALGGSFGLGFCTTKAILTS